MGDILISNNFDLRQNKPIDSRFTVEDIGERDAISFLYDGLIVYVKNPGVFQYWNGAVWADTNNSNSGIVTEEVSLPTGTVISGDNVDTGLTVGINVTGYINVIINGLETEVVDDISGPFYFSSDSGVTATTVFLGSNLYWNQSIAGYTLDDEDTIIFKS